MATTQVPPVKTQSDQPKANQPSNAGVPTKGTPCTEVKSEHQFPEFPNEAYLGVGAAFADLYSRQYDNPKEFFYFDFLMLVANSLSGVVRADFGALKTHTRLYGLKIGPSGTSKKSTSYAISEEFVRKAWSKALETVEDTFWNDDSDRSRKVFKIVPGVGSAEGLLAPLNQSRVLVYFDEFDRFIKKAGTEGSVLGTAFNELFERTNYSNYTKENQTEVRNGHLGMVANIPLEQFETMTSSGKLGDLGLWNRFAYVVGDRRHECDRVTNVPAEKLNDLIDQLAQYFSLLCEDIEKKGKQGSFKERQLKKDQILQMTPEAWEIWKTLKTVVGAGETVTRLDTIGMRLITVLAITSGKREIDAEVINAAIAFLRYQKEIRENYHPSQAETQEAKIEEMILRQLARRGPLTKRELRQYTNARRYGAQRFSDALDALAKDKQINSSVVGSSQRFSLPKEENS